MQFNSILKFFYFTLYKEFFNTIYRYSEENSKKVKKYKGIRKQHLYVSGGGLIHVYII